MLLIILVIRIVASANLTKRIPIQIREAMLAWKESIMFLKSIDYTWHIHGILQKTVFMGICQEIEAMQYQYSDPTNSVEKWKFLLEPLLWFGLSMLLYLGIKYLLLTLNHINGFQLISSACAMFIRHTLVMFILQCLAKTRVPLPVSSIHLLFTFAALLFCTAAKNKGSVDQLFWSQQWWWFHFPSDSNTKALWGG